MEPSVWITSSSEERQHQLEEARGVVLSQTNLNKVFEWLRSELEESLRDNAQVLSVTTGMNPESRMHDLIVHVDEELPAEGQSIPALFYDVPVHQIQLGWRRRDYWNNWRVVLGGILRWPDWKIDESLRWSESLSKNVLFYYRSPWFYMAPHLIDAWCTPKILGLQRVKALKAVEELLQRNAGVLEKNIDDVTAQMKAAVRAIQGELK